jgi:hypothetical protein
MKSFSWRPLAAALPCLTLWLSALAAPAAAQLVHFDGVVAAPGGTLFGGGTFAASGVVFRSVNIPNGVFVGQVITLSNVEPRLLVIGNSHAISAPNFAAASGVFTGGPNDVLMSFSSPVTSVSVVTDDTPAEGADIVRLIALAPASTPGKFVVTAIDSGLDNGVFPFLNFLSLDLQNKPASFVVFQVTTEAEGFDNLRFEHQPDCARSEGRIDPACFEVPPYKEWILVGCEIVDCCPGCPGDIFEIDWVMDVDGDRFDNLVLQFADLSREVAAGLRVEGNATWSPERMQLEIKGPGRVALRGFTADKAGLRWSAASPRVTLERIDAAPSTGASRALRVGVQQKVGEADISHSTLVYSY